MKKIYSFIFACLFILEVNAQPPCRLVLNDTGVIDIAPGCLLCQDFYVNSLQGFTPDTVGVDFPCGDIIGNQWLTVRADTLGKIVASTFFGTCPDDSNPGIKIRLYDLNLNPVSDCENYCDRDDRLGTLLDVENLVPGEPYLLMIDFCDLDMDCDVLLFFEQYKPTISMELPTINVEPDYNSYCIGNQVCYSSTGVDGSDGFQWQIDTSELGVIAGGGLKDSFICVEYLEKGQGTITLQPLFECWAGSRASMQYNVLNIDLDIQRIICPGETYSVGNETFDKEGDYTVAFQNPRLPDCDSVVNLELLIPDTSAIEIGCFLDTFLNAVTFFWDDRPLAYEYQIILNDSILPAQPFKGLIYQYENLSEVLNLTIQPVGAHGCDYSSGQFVCRLSDLTAIPQVDEKNDIQVFPNPSTGTFDVFSEKKIEKIEVFDLSGRKQKEVFTSQVDLSNFDSSIYYLKVFFDEKAVLKKVVKM